MSESYLKTLAEELMKGISNESVIGEPIIQDDKVLIPVSRLGLAMGSGSGKGTGNGQGGEGAAGGGGGGIEPIAVIVVYKDVRGPEGVQILPLKAPSKWPEAVGKIVENLASMQDKKKIGNPEKEEKPAELP